MIARGLLNNIADRAGYVPYFINFSAQTSSKRTQEMIEGKLEKKRKTVLGKFIDPDKDIYEDKIVIIFLPINLNMCFGFSKEMSH